MAHVSENEIKRDIKSGMFSPVYILYGEDAYLKKHYSDEIVRRVCGDDTDFNLQVFEQSAEMQNVYEAVNQFPMMADKKCVVLNDYDIEHADKDEIERLYEILADVPDTAVFILRFDSVPFDVKKSSRAKKTVSSAEKSGGKAVLLGHRETGDLVSMLCRGAKQRGCTVSPENARYLTECAGEDISTLINELDKLCLFLGEGEIGRAEIDRICSKTVEASVYDYVKEILALNITGALSLLDDMFYMHIEPMMIFYTVSACYTDMYRMHCAKGAGKGKDEVAADFAYGNRAFTLNRASYNLRKFTPKKLEKSLDILLEADKTLKSFSGDERSVMEELTVKLGLIIASGDNK